MHPLDATSPKWRIAQGTIDVIYIHPSNEWSLATMTYDGHPALGMRWNGDLNDPRDLGYPSARGNGAWFIVPPEVEPMMRAYMAVTKVPEPA